MKKNGRSKGKAKGFRSCSAYLPNAMADRLERLAEDQGRSFSAQVAFLLKKQLRRTR